jgi:hypothetical protein
MGWTDVAVPPSAQTGFEVLLNMAEAGTLDCVKGKVSYRKSAEDRDACAAGGKKNGRLREKWEALRSECPEASKQSVYIAEMRMLESTPCDDGLRKKRKSTMKKTFRERMYKLGMDVRAMPFWDDFSEGFFVGAGCSSYDLHIDCIPSSNVGSVYAGHKLLATWGFLADSKAVMKKHGREHFAKPLTASQVSALEGAQCIGLAPPGSVYMFSGAVAHTVCNVGFGLPGPSAPPAPSLVVGSYEAFVNLHPRHLQAFVDTVRAARDEEESDTEDLDLFERDIVDGALDMHSLLQKGELRERDAASAALEYLRANSKPVRLALDAQEKKLPDSKRQKRSSGSDADELTKSPDSDCDESS